MPLRSVLLIGLALVGAASSRALAASPPGVTVSDGWMRFLTPRIPAGGYFTLHNGGQDAEVLDGARSPDCGMLMLHQSSDLSGMARMQDVGSVLVPAGGTVSFAPGGYHLMCMQPSPALHLGGKIPVTLTFQDGSSLTTSFSVRGPTGP